MFVIRQADSPSEKPIGFVALKVHNPYTAEICVMGVLKEYHRGGIGRQLVSHCEAFCPLEVFPLYWDEENPCLLMAKALS